MQARSKSALALLGRQREREALDGLIADLRSGHGRALVLRGEAGVSKSALLWLDRVSARVLAFVARRLLAEPVGLVFAARVPGDELSGLADLEVRGLRDEDARGLLRSVVRVRLDEQVRDRILAETHGNPLALLELPRGLSPAQLAGGFGLAGGRLTRNPGE